MQVELYNIIPLCEDKKSSVDFKCEVVSFIKKIYFSTNANISSILFFNFLYINRILL